MRLHEIPMLPTLDWVSVSNLLENKTEIYMPYEILKVHTKHRLCFQCANGWSVNWITCYRGRHFLNPRIMDLIFDFNSSMYAGIKLGINVVLLAWGGGINEWSHNQLSPSSSLCRMGETLCSSWHLEHWLCNHHQGQGMVPSTSQGEIEVNMSVYNPHDDDNDNYLAAQWCHSDCTVIGCHACHVCSVASSNTPTTPHHHNNIWLWFEDVHFNSWYRVLWAIYLLYINVVITII